MSCPLDMSWHPWYTVTNKLMENPMKFENLKFVSHPAEQGGIRAVQNFDNNYGVSVIRTPFSYGSIDNLYEVAILKDQEICYDTPLTDDVIGYCTPEIVEQIMKEVSKL